MLEINVKEGKELMESHLRDCFANSWGSFTEEIGMSGIEYIGKEIKPYSSTKYSIDILAFDKKEQKFVVFELKRSKSGDQLLQSLSYAAMIDKWKVDGIPQRIKPKNKELMEWIMHNKINFGIKIVLIAESFVPKVLLTADWFVRKYKFDICACTIDYVDRKRIAFDSQKSIEELLNDSERKEREQYEKKIEAWCKKQKEIKHPFINEAIDELLNKEYETDFDLSEKNNRFYINHNQDGFKTILVYFYSDYVRIYSRVEHEKMNEVEDNLKENINHNLKLKRREDGWSFWIYEKTDYKKLTEWLNI